MIGQEPGIQTRPALAPEGLGIEVSVLVPVRERPEPLELIYREYAEPLRRSGKSYEFLFILDPRHAGLSHPLRELAAQGEPVRVLTLAQPFGEATFMKVGAEAARGSVLLTLPAYRRIAAGALPALVQRVQEGVEVVVARRWPRQDPWTNRLQSAVFHSLIAGLSRQRLHDVASGVLCMPIAVLQDLPLYGDFARFLPLFAQRAGYRVEEVESPQHPQDARFRFYGPGVYLRRLIDILGVYFVLRFTEKPLRFFGLIGAALFASGTVLLAVLGVQRLGGQGISNRPLLLLAVLLVVLGVQAVALGLIGEIIVHFLSSRRRSYRLARDPS